MISTFCRLFLSDPYASDRRVPQYLWMYFRIYPTGIGKSSRTVPALGCRTCVGDWADCEDWSMDLLKTPFGCQQATCQNWHLERKDFDYNFGWTKTNRIELGRIVVFGFYVINITLFDLLSVNDYKSGKFVSKGVNPQKNIFQIPNSIAKIAILASIHHLWLSNKHSLL